MSESQSETELKTPTPATDDGCYRKPSPYCMFLLQKLVLAAPNCDSSEIDWDAFAATMHGADPALCELIFNWLKETHSGKIALVFRGSQLPAADDSTEPSTSTLLGTSSADLLIPSTSGGSMTRLSASASDVTGLSPNTSPVIRPASEMARKNKSSSVATESSARSESKATSSSVADSSVKSSGVTGRSVSSSESVPLYSTEGSRSNLLSEREGSLGSGYSTSAEYLLGSTGSQESINGQRTGSAKIECVSELHSSPTERSVCVVVHDAVRNLEKTFYCPRYMLADYMPYFNERMKEVPDDGDVQISLHCDVVVFEKLMAYVNKVAAGDEKSFKIDPNYAIHLLVSADFLYMDHLTEKCLDYCHRHLSAIVQSNSPIGAMTDPLIERLAGLFNHRELEALEDPADRIKGKLYKKLLDKLLRPDDESPGHPGTPKLMRCTLCEQIFVTKLQDSIPCKHKKLSLGPRGELVYTHKRDTNWNCDQYLEEQLSAAETWRGVYWRLWGLVSTLYCTTCHKEFCCSDFTRCRYHKEPLQFPQSENEQNSLHQLGTFPCCGRTTYMFDPIDPLHVNYGCCYKNHTVSSEDRPGDTFQDMLSYYDLIYQPRTVELNSFEYSGLQRIVPIFSDKVISDWVSMVGMVSGRPVKPRKVAPKKSGSAEVIAEPTLVSEPFVSVLSSLTVPSKSFSIKPAWKMRTTHWHNQDVVRDHDNAVMDRLMAQLQKMQPAPRTRHSSRK